MSTNTQPQTQQSGGDELRNALRAGFALYHPGVDYAILPPSMQTAIDWRVDAIITAFNVDKAAAVERSNLLGKILVLECYDSIAPSEVADRLAAMKKKLQPNPQAGEGGELQHPDICQYPGCTQKRPLLQNFCLYHREAR